MNKEKRNLLIDYARYVFAFLVVCIHVLLAHGGTLYMPLARCAVPFFYLVTGYFLSISLFLLISVILDICFHQMGRWTSTDSQRML